MQALHAGLFPGRKEPCVDEDIQGLVCPGLCPNWRNALHVPIRKIVIGEMTQGEKVLLEGAVDGA
jgi:hypothetical protein